MSQKKKTDELTERKERELRALFNVVDYAERDALFGKEPIRPLTDEQVNHFLHDYPELTRETRRRAEETEEMWEDVDAGKVGPREAMDRTIGRGASERLLEEIKRNADKVKKLFTPSKQEKLE